ncbi:uncharacterized protein ACA1_192950 [Acanthamoeba castellanii str. Neff]|uniref:Uncharacterized protein n=1 Tax=Acanthamoeba castellanii (strain ATCC 30010 / Neff) TaxID=1257118 RepID=L8GNE1_ACACF|nr:uncharacterized protein ACA1_192950 [Acanthamoeba castellanii str. Neff]ELR14502.1 hypothetical protein ACA1_192950 [Acanthamoeba castellanii str. Neff]
MCVVGRNGPQHAGPLDRPTVNGRHTTQDALHPASHADQSAVSAAAADGTLSRRAHKPHQQGPRTAAAKRKPSSATATASSPTSTASPSRKEAEKSINRLTAKRDN